MGKSTKKPRATATLAALRAHPWKTSSAIYALGTFATAGYFATQLLHAPLSPAHTPPSIPKTTPQMLYCIPPAATLIITLLEIYILAKKKKTRRFQMALGGLMIFGWVATTAAWGHCHLNFPQEGAQNAWQAPAAQDLWQKKVCYQYNLKYQGHGYIEGVSHQLGDAVVAMGAIMVVFYAGFTWKIARNKGAPSGDPEMGEIPIGFGGPPPGFPGPM